MRTIVCLLAFLMFCTPGIIIDNFEEKANRPRLHLPKKEMKPLKLNYDPYPGFVLDSHFGDWLDTVHMDYKLWD